MKRSRLLTALLVLVCLAAGVRAEPTITIRLYYKVITSPINGAVPSGYSEGGVANAVARMNQLMESYGRGYRFDHGDGVRPIGNIGGVNRPDPAHYYSVNLLGDPTERANLLDDASSLPSLYGYSTPYLNIFINNASQDTRCYLPSSPMIVIDGATSVSGERTLHHIMHFLSLCNTQGCTCYCCDGGSGACGTSPGSDGVSDTLPDLPCWSRDEVAQNNFSAPYAQLSTVQQNSVDNTFFNIMSFHNTFLCGQTLSAPRLTDTQLDRSADDASSTHRGVCDGSTYFVQANATGFGNGRSSSPFPRIADGVHAAQAGGNIVMIRGGNYPEPLNVSVPVTLRTPKGQTARIGQ